MNTTDTSITPSRTVSSSLAPEWTPERENIVRRVIAPPSATKEEVEFFLAWCRRTGLDPFIKQAYFVERRAQVGGQWVTRHEPMASEAGMAGVVDAQPDFAGMKGATVYAGDEFAVDEVSGEVIHRWNLTDRARAGNKVLGAWAHCLRRDRVTPVVYLPFDSRVQRTKEGSPTQFWARDPSGMISKCARAQARRVAYPNALSGVYLREEVRDEEVDVTPSTQPPSPTASKTSALRARLGLAASTAPAQEPPAASTLPAGAPPIPADVRERMDADHAAEEPSPMAAAAAALREKASSEAPPASPPRSGPHVAPLTHLRFGKAKGKALADCTMVELEEALDVATAALAKAKGTEAWVAPTREGIDAVEQEIDQRHAALGDAPEPGAEG